MRAVQTPIIPTVGQWIRANPGTLSLAQGVVFYPPPPQVRIAMEEFLRSGDSKYGPVEGQPGLRAAIAEKIARENGIVIGDAPDRVMVTAGGNMAFLNAMFAICDTGDEVILPLPYYFNHEMAVRMVGANPVLVASDENYGLDVDAIRAAITVRTRAIVTISPNNPSGMVHPRHRLTAINDLCRDAGIFHISDEAYEHFTYEDAQHFSPGSIPGSSAHTISVFSLSKSFGFASWRIGYMIVPPQLFPALLKAQDTNLICANLAAQQAAAAIINSAASYRQRHLSSLAKVRETVMSAISTLGADCSISASQGAFYFLLRLNTELDDLTLTERLIREHRVAVLPGSAFGIEGGCALRLSYGALDPQTAIAGIERLVSGLAQLIHRKP